MSNSQRRKAPRLPSQPDYRLHVTGAIGRSCRHVGVDSKGLLIGEQIRALAPVFRGAGLASAVRALRKRGYVVEKVPC